MSEHRRAAERFEILAYCVMPDHLHLLVEGVSDDADFRRFVKMTKQRSGAAYALRTTRPLWQEGYFDRLLREGDDVVGIVRYLLENPVRAKLVADVREYPFLGSDRWTLGELFDRVQDR